METFTPWIIAQNVDMAHGEPAPSLWPNALMMYGDNLAHVWRVGVLLNGAACDLTGWVCSGSFRRTDGSTVYIEGATDGNVAIVELKQECYAYPGELWGAMRITRTSDHRTITLSALVFHITKELTDAIVDPGNVIPSLEELLQAVGDCEAATSAANTAAGSATTAAGAANTAATSATSSAAAANTAAGNANTAAGAANAAATAANNAKDAANTAAGAANTAAASATSSAAAANTAASEANAAAAAANQLAGTVHQLEKDVERIDWKTGVKKYIIRWDKTNAACARLGDAASIGTDITHYCHRGSVDSGYSNPFDGLYPWNHRKLCKVNRATYAEKYAAGADIMEAITAWEGETGFALDGSGDFDGVYTPAFWGYVWQDENYVYAAVADGEVQGWHKFEETVGGRYHGSLDENGKVTSIAGGIAWRGSAMSTMHANAKAQSLTLDDIYTWSADTLLMCVEYATMNTKNAVGNGCSDLYSQGGTGSEYHPAEEAAIGGTTLTIPNAMASALVIGGVIDVGTSNGGTNVCYVRTTAAPANLASGHAAYATHKQVAVTALPAAVTTAHFIALHGCYNAPDSEIGSKSGYIGTNGKCNAYYRGRLTHGDYWRYVLGAYRQTGTAHIWIANSRADANNADALNTSVHTDTGKVLPNGAEGIAAEGYLNSLHVISALGLAPFGSSVGGSSGNPIGDYIYVPTLATGNTVLLAGASASNGTYVGRFCGHWNATAGIGSWNLAVFPFLIAP